MACRPCQHEAGTGVASLSAGMLGYAHFEHLGWLDAFLNAAMLLGGMGPVESPQTPAASSSPGSTRVYSGMVFLVVAGVAADPRGPPGAAQVSTWTTLPRDSRWQRNRMTSTAVSEMEDPYESALLLVVAALETAAQADASAPSWRTRRWLRAAASESLPSSCAASVRPFQLGRPNRGPRVLDSASPPQTQLTNRRTRVSCTMRVAPSAVDGPGDPGWRGTVVPDPDPIVRNDVVPCVK